MGILMLFFIVLGCLIVSNFEMNSCEPYAELFLIIELVMTFVAIINIEIE